MRLLHTFSFVLFFTITSIGQSFTLQELIKMSKMDVDNFDTYVTAKGYVFFNNIDETEDKGVRYVFDLNDEKSEAQKLITLYNKYGDKTEYAINYVTGDNKEYVAIKNQIKLLGFKLYQNKVSKDENGSVYNTFFYGKGHQAIYISAYLKRFEIQYDYLNF
jgi:hypothetical protein